MRSSLVLEPRCRAYRSGLRRQRCREKTTLPVGRELFSSRPAARAASLLRGNHRGDQSKSSNASPSEFRSASSASKAALDGRYSAVTVLTTGVMIQVKGGQPYQ